MLRQECQNGNECSDPGSQFCLCAKLKAAEETRSCREEGYYWVRAIDKAYPGVGIAKWSNDSWAHPGITGTDDDGTFEVLSPRLVFEDTERTKKSEADALNELYAGITEADWEKSQIGRFSLPVTDGLRVIAFVYKNWRGEVDLRRAIPVSIDFASTVWHPEPQWLLRAFDLDRREERLFALRDMSDMVRTYIPHAEIPA